MSNRRTESKKEKKIDENQSENQTFRNTLPVKPLMSIMASNKLSNK